MIFVDTNVFMFAVGRPHPLRSEARAFFEKSLENRDHLVTSAEVLQELLHAYLPVSRLETLERALRLAEATVSETWSLEADDVHLADALLGEHPDLEARDLIHLATCRRRGVDRIRTFDRRLRAVFGTRDR